MKKLLLVDIGNTNIVLALNKDEKWYSFSRIKSKDSDAVANFEQEIKSIDFNCAVLSSVVPDLTQDIFECIKKNGTEPLIVDRTMNSGLKKETIPPELGSDLLCNLIAAHHYYPDEYVTIADFGTAFTTSTVSPTGEFKGVTISPGMMTSVKALFQNTAQLPQIKLDLPKTVLGKNTIDSIRAGVLYGFVGQVEAIVKQIEKELGSKVKLVLTGGLSRYVEPYISNVSKSDILFTLEGAKLFYEMNEENAE